MNLGKILSSFAKHYKPGHGGFALNKPVNSNGVTEQSYAGVQVPMQNPTASPLIKNADPQSNYRTRMNMVEGNPLNFIGDMGTKLGGGENGRVEIMAEKLPLGTEKDLTRRPFETMGIDQIKEYPAQGQGFDGAYPTEMEGQPLSGLGAALAKTKGEINRREGKDFRKGGADYDKDHDFKDVLRSFGIGALQSLAQADPSRESLGMMLGRGLGGGISGGIGGALDRNADEKMGNKIALGNLYQDYAKQLGVQDAELGISKKQKDLENTDRDNVRLEQKAADDVELKKLDQELRRDRLMFDKEKAAELAQLRRDQLAYKKEGDEKSFALAQQRIDELTRHNKVTEGQGERRTKAIESRASAAATKAKSSAPQGKRTGKLTDAQIIKIASGIDDDFNNGKIDEATYNARINLMLEGINGRNR